MIVEPGSSSEPNMESELPPLSVDTMSQVQLTEFIPYLVCLVTGRQHPYFGKSQFKPEWWPDNVAWIEPDFHEENTQNLKMQTQQLKSIVRSCYKHLGQESLLSGATEPDVKAKNDIPETASSHKASSQLSEGSQENSEEPIWICFLCAKQFVNQDELMTHQDLCEKESEEEENVPSASPPRTRILRPRRPVKKPSHIVIQPKEISFHPQPFQPICHKKRVFSPEPYIPPKKEDFLKTLKLSDKPKEPPRIATPVSDIDSDCEIVDVTYDESIVKAQRTPKSLMSQLNRDIEHSARRRHLSFSQVLDGPEGNSSDISDSESENGSQKKPKMPFGTLLCGIDLTSPLGQRVKKHWKIDTNYSIINGEKIESFCSGPMKNDFVEKLRHRGETSYPIVFNKKNRKHMARHKHEYKFNASHRKEFMIRLKTGLSKRSRKYLRDIVKCSVTLEPLKLGVIKRWTRRKPPPPYPYAYIRRMFEQEHPIIKKIVQKPVPGPKFAKLRQISEGLRKLNRPHNLLPNQRMVTKVVQNPDGTSSMKMVCAPSTSMIRPQYNNAGNNRRKQTFDQNTVKQMDPMEIDIIELSSSDDEDQPQQQPQQRQTAPAQVMHYKNITGVPGRPTQPQMMSLIHNKPSVTNSVPQQVTILNTPNITFAPRQNLQVPRPANASDTRARIYQGARGMLNPSNLQNKSGIQLHSSPPGASTIKESMQNSKPVTGLVNRAIFKDSSPQILRNSSNSPSKFINRNSPKACNFQGFVPMKHTETVSSESPQGFMQHSVHQRLTNGSPLPHNSVSPQVTKTEPRSRDPIMESEVIIIDDD